MCVSDWRIGRLIRTQATAFDSTVPTGLTYNPNRQRVGILIVPTPSAFAVTQVVIATFLNGTKIVFDATAQAKLLSMQEFGELTTFGFTLTVVGTITTGVVTEFFLPEEIIQAGLDEFRRSYPF